MGHIAQQIAYTLNGEIKIDVKEILNVCYTSFMENKKRCQSCGMPISDKFSNFGTNADGAKNPLFCSFCFQKGSFTNPNQTLDEMVQSSIKNMTVDQGMPQEQAETLAKTFIPSLGRWN